MLNRSDSVCVDILTYEDLIQLRTRSKRRHDDVFTSTTTSKRYLILTYAAEFDRVCYPLPLCPETEPDTAAMQRTILRLRHEIEILRLGTTTNNRHGTNNTSYDVLKVEYNELQAAHESLMHETESRIQSLREENERLREEISVFRCEEAAEPTKKSNMIVTLKRRLRATERTLEQERLAHQRAREISEKVEADLRRELSSSRSTPAERRRRARSVSINRSNYARPIGRVRRKKKIGHPIKMKKQRKKKNTGRRVRSASPCVFKRFDPTAYEEQRRQKLKAVRERRQRQIKRAMSPVPRRRGRSLTVRTRKVDSDDDDDNISRARSIGSRRSKNSRRSKSSVRSKNKKKKKKISTRDSSNSKTSRMSRSKTRSNQSMPRMMTGSSLPRSNQRKPRMSRSKSEKISTKENRTESTSRALSKRRKKKKKKTSMTKERSVTDHWMNLNGPSVRVTPQRKTQAMDESVAMKSFRTDAADINEIDARLNKLQHFLRAAKKGESISDLPRV